MKFKNINPNKDVVVKNPHFRFFFQNNENLNQKRTSNFSFEKRFDEYLQN